MRNQLIKRVSILGSLHRIADAITIAVCCGIAHFVKFGDLTIATNYYYFSAALILLTINIFSAFSIYENWMEKSFRSQITRLSLSWIIIALVIGAFTFITKTGPYFSRAWVIWTFLLTYTGLISYRVILKTVINHLQKAGYNQKQVIIIGAGTLGQKAYNAMLEQTWAGLIPIAYFDDEEYQELDSQDIKIEGKIHEVISFIEQQRKTKPVDHVWIALPLSAQEKIEKLQIALQDTATKIYFIPDLFGFNLASYSIDQMVGLPVMNMSAPPMKAWSSTLKRIEDIIISIISLIIFSPLFLVVAFLIKKDSTGPVFFKQIRYGQDGKEISVWKFRSMSVSENGDNIKQARRNDARITKIGAFLRKSSIDELPQLINVLKGSMSIVGPRPHAVAHNEFYRSKVQGYMVRHQMRPGITGWAQVNGSRGETAELEDMEERIRLDLDYIQNWSIFLDIQIILMTFKTVFDTKNTY